MQTCAQTTVSTFKAVQTGCYEGNLVVTDKAGDVFGFASQGYDVLQASKKARSRVEAFKASEAEHLTKIDAFENHKRELFVKNRRFESQLAVCRVEKKDHKAQD